MIKGIPFPFEGEALVLPPLSLGALEAMQERIESFKGGLDKESIAIVIDAALVALQRNYPDITRQKVGDLIGLENMMDVFEALMDVSGTLRKKKEAEAGEALAPSIGAASTPG